MSDNKIHKLESGATDLRRHLTPNQALFCSEYLKDRNATRAYLAAYPNCKGDNVAAAAAVRLLRNVKVHNYLENELEIVRLRNSISTDNLLREEACICFSDIRKLFDSEGKPIPSDQLPEDVSKALASVKIKERKVKDGDGYATETTYEYKFWDKGAALGRMERHLGMYVDRREISGPSGRAIKVEDMSDNEKARRIAFALHKQIRKMEKNCLNDELFRIEDIHWQS